MADKLTEAALEASAGRDFKLDWTLHGPEGIRIVLMHALPRIKDWGCSECAPQAGRVPIWYLRITEGTRVKFERAWCVDHVPGDMPLAWAQVAAAVGSLLANNIERAKP